MNQHEYRQSGIPGHYDPVTDAYYTEAQYSELLAGRALADVAPPEKSAKPKTAEPVNDSVIKPSTQD